MDQESTKPGPIGSKGSWRDRLGINKELPKISEEFKQPPSKAGAPDHAEPAPEQPPPPRLGTPVSKPAPMAPRQPMGDLGDRIRQQREAAERMAEKRVAEAKERAVQQPRPAPSSGAGAPPPAGQRPKFTFAEEEFRQAHQEPREPPPRQWSPASQPMNSTRPVFTADRPTQPADRQPHAGDARSRPTAPPRTPPAAGPGTYSRPQHPAVPPRARPPNYPPTSYPPANPRSDRQWQPRPPRSAQPGTYDPYRRDMPPPPQEGAYFEEDPYARHHAPHAPPQHEGQRPRSPDFRGAHSRELAYVQQEGDDLFEEEQNYSPQPRRRAGPQDYNQAYREFEGPEEGPARRRRGPFILLASLLVVMAIIAGVGWMYYQRSGSGPSQAEVPVVAEPEQPVKTEPESDSAADEPIAVPTETDTANAPATQTPAQKKQIYDRILGETTLEEQEQMAPSQEQPVSPNEPVQGFDAEPLPLPLPPPPGGEPDDQGALPTPGSTQATAERKSAPAELSGQASPVSASLEESRPDSASSEPSGPLPVPGAGAAEPSAESASPPQPAQAKIADAAPLAQDPAVPSAGASAEAAGAGPIQIAQIPAADGIESGTAPAFDTIPQALPDVTTQPKRRTMGRAGDRVVINANRNFNKQKPVQTALVATDPFTTETIAEPIAETPQLPPAEPVQQQPAVESAAEQPVQQQAALPPAAPIEPSPAAQPPQANLSGFVIQLASHKTEADALADYNRLRQQHGASLGQLNYAVQKTKLNTGATFYQLHLGSFPSRQAARDMCSSLLAAGERDCLVKSR
jgi:hypothetical protein